MAEITKNETKNGIAELSPWAKFELEVSSRSIAKWKPALPPHVSLDGFVAAAKFAVGRSDALFNADRSSLYEALLSAAKLGLDCSGLLGAAYLSVFAGKVQLIVGYKGYVDLAHRSGHVASISAVNVYAGERFSVTRGTKEEIVHIPDYSVEHSYDTLVLSYSVAHLVRGGVQFAIMTKKQIEAIRVASKAKNGPWRTNPEAMALKCPVLRVMKLLPLSSEMAYAARADAEFSEDTAPTIRDASFTLNQSDANDVPPVADVREPGAEG